MGVNKIPTDSSLSLAIQTSDKISMEIELQHMLLSNNLVAKGVEVLPTDKMSNLIDKVGTISTGKKWASGTSVTPSGALTFNGWLTGSVTRSYIDIVGLDFLPSVIIITRPTFISYVSFIINSELNPLFDAPIHFGHASLSENLSVAGSTVYTIPLTKSPAIFEIGNIRTPVYSGGNSGYNVAYNWIAFE